MDVAQPLKSSKKHPRSSNDGTPIKENTSTGEDDGDDSPSLMSIEDLPNPLLLAGIIFLTGLLPLGLATVTAFVKIVVVLSILRNALGLQQTPPNLVINAGAIVLTLYVMYPVVIKIGNGLEALPPGREGLVLITSAIPIVIENIRAFMSPLIEPGKLDFFHVKRPPRSGRPMSWRPLRPTTS